VSTLHFPSSNARFQKPLLHFQHYSPVPIPYSGPSSRPHQPLPSQSQTCGSGSCLDQGYSTEVPSLSTPRTSSSLSLELKLPNYYQFQPGGFQVPRPHDNRTPTDLICITILKQKKKPEQTIVSLAALRIPPADDLR
jgi:hypothetical protein